MPKYRFGRVSILGIVAMDFGRYIIFRYLDPEGCRMPCVTL